MRKNLFAVSLLTMAASTFAQPVASREVHADRRVTFRLRAPQAQEVIDNGWRGLGKPTSIETAGGHSFRVWRRYLTDFLPLLFQN